MIYISRWYGTLQISSIECKHHVHLRFSPTCILDQKKKSVCLKIRTYNFIHQPADSLFHLQCLYINAHSKVYMLLFEQNALQFLQIHSYISEKYHCQLGNLVRIQFNKPNKAGFLLLSWHDLQHPVKWHFSNRNSIFFFHFWLCYYSLTFLCHLQIPRVCGDDVSHYKQQES